MVQSIELLLDDAADAAIRMSWAALAGAGLPSLASHPGASNRPHVTVAATDATGYELAVDRLRAELDTWSAGPFGFTATVGAPVLFGGAKQRWVLARQVVPSRRLLAMHAAVHRALELHAPGAEPAPSTRPDAWTPHVTLARRMPADRLGEALAAVDVTPLACHLVAARLWDSTTKTVTPLT